MSGSVVGRSSLVIGNNQVSQAAVRERHGCIKISRPSTSVIPTGVRPSALGWSNAVEEPAVWLGRQTERIPKKWRNDCAMNSNLRGSMAVRIMFLAISLLWAASAYASTDASRTCSVTKPNGYTPRAEPTARNRHGNKALSTVLNPEGTVEFRSGGPGFVLPDGSLMMKFPWWKETQDKLTITGRRLDAPAPPLRADVGASDDFHMVPTYIIFPTIGCWEVTGKAGNATLTFVTRVVKIGSGP